MVKQLVRIRRIYLALAVLFFPSDVVGICGSHWGNVVQM